MAGGKTWKPDEDAMLRRMTPLEYYTAVAGTSSERGLPAIEKRKSQLNAIGRAGSSQPPAREVYPEDDVQSPVQFSVPPRNEPKAPRYTQSHTKNEIRGLPYDDLDAPPRFREDSTDDELWDYLEQSFDRRGGQTTHDPIVRSFRSGPIGIAFVSDVHVGGGGVDLSRFRADAEHIARTPHLYAVFNGDLLENTKPQLKSATALYSAQFANPKEQYGYALSRMDICRDKWLVITQGNHDAFDYRVAGIDRLEMLAHQLGVPYRTEAGATIKLTVGEQEYVIVAKHDYKGKSQLNKSNSQRRLWDEWPHEWDNADVVALAHLHEPLVEHVMRKGREVVYLRSGSYKVVDAWAEAGGYKPAYGVPVVILWPDERKLVAFPGSRFLDACDYLTSLSR